MQFRVVREPGSVAHVLADKPWIALAALTVLAAAVRAFHLAFPLFWNDEYATYVFATEPLGRVLGPDYRVETNPPLYYLLQRAWLALGDSRAAMRSLPLLCGVATIPLTFALGRKLAGTGAALIAAALVATSQLHVHYSREVRCYSLLTAACLGALTCLASILTRHRVLQPPEAALSSDASSTRSELGLWLGYAGCMLLALYTHGTAILFLALSAVLFGGLVAARLVDRTLFTRWLWVHTCIGLLFLPRLLVLVNQSRDVLPDFWVPASTPAWVYAQLLGAYPFPKWSKPIFFLLFGYGIWSLRKRQVAAAFALTFVVGQPCLLYVASLFRHVFLVRALVWPTAVAFVVMAHGLWTLGERAGARQIVFASACLCALQLTTLRTELPEQHRLAPAAAFVEPLRAFRPDTDRLVFAPLEFAWVLWYEARALGLSRQGLGVTFGDRPLQLEQWYGAEHIKRAQVVPTLGATRKVWLLLERKPKFRPAQGAGFENVVAELEQWGSITQRWTSGPLELLAIERRGLRPDTTRTHAATSPALGRLLD